MIKLIDYLEAHAIQNEADGADVIFFKVKATPDANAEELKAAIVAHEGEFNEVDLFDGKEHGYIELGGWVGDQGFALMLIGLGAELGLWKLLTPKTVLGDTLPDEMVMGLAGQGLITMQYIGG